MIQINEFSTDTSPVFSILTLAYDQRQKSRLSVCLDNGDQAAIILPRSRSLKDGDMLKTSNGELVKVIAAKEEVSVVYSENTLLLMKACYHLANRHTPLQIEEKSVRYQSDHVLDKMIVQLGLSVKTEQSTFEPESGAYSHH